MTDSANELAAAGLRRPFTVKSFLVPLLTHPRIARIVKYTVYISLFVNFGFYLTDDYLAYRAALSENATIADVLQQFSTSIDMAAWLGLVFLFELETYALPDEAFEGWVPRTLLGARVICYALIGFAAYGYTAETLENFEVSPVVGVDNICQLAGQGIFLQLDVIVYEEIATDNCSQLSDDSQFFHIGDDVSVVDASTLKHVQWMGWIDIVNACVWIFVVLLIELEVRLQAADRFASRTLTVARQTKTFFYLVLIIDGFIWAYTNYWPYAWDAFLWIFGFWAIELNLAEWERDRVKELRERLANAT